MAKAKKYDHIHKYERRKLGSFKSRAHDIYKCTLPGCNHYILDMEVVVGRYSKCWGVPGSTTECPNVVLLTRYAIFNEKRKRPICDECKLEKKLAKMTPEERFEYFEMQGRIDAAVDKLMILTQGLSEDEEDDDPEYD